MAVKRVRARKIGIPMGKFFTLYNQHISDEENEHVALLGYLRIVSVLEYSIIKQ